MDRDIPRAAPDDHGGLHAAAATGTVADMERLRRVTVRVPASLLRRAQAACGGDAAGAIRRGLELVAAKEAYAHVRSLRGRLKLDIEVAELREDR